MGQPIEMKTSSAAAAAPAQYVCFKIQDQLCGLKIENVVEVISQYEITPIVHTPDFLQGVINLRGEIIAIVDLRRLFGLPAAPLTADNRIVIVSLGDKTAGLLADEVSQIRWAVVGGTDDLPVTVTGKMAEFLSGVGNLADRPFLVLNLENLFNSEEMKQFE